MIIIDKITSDDRLMKSHIIIDRIVDMTTFIITVKLGSFMEEEPTNLQIFYKEFYVEIFKSDYQFSYLDEETLEAEILTLPWKHIDEIDSQTLEELKKKKRRDIDDWRAEERYSNTVVAVDGIDYIWQSDSDSQTLISNAVSFAASGIASCPPIWRTFDDVDVAVDLDDLKNIVGAMAQKTTEAFYRSFQLKQLVEAATTPEQLEEITWSTEI